MLRSQNASLALLDWDGWKKFADFAEFPGNSN